MLALCVGDSSLEITGKLNSSFQDGSNLNLKERFECGGGISGSVSYLLGKWGVDTYIASMMGSDDYADKIKKEYENIGIKTDYLETTYDKQTNLKLILVNDENKTSTIIRIGDYLNLKKATFLGNADLIFLDGTDLQASLNALDKNPNANSFLLLKEVNNDTQELCRYVKNIIFSHESIELMTGINILYNNPNTIVSSYNRLKQKFNKEIIFILNNNNVVYSINNQIKIMPPIHNEVVNPYGFETVFCGAYMYGMGRTFGLEKSIAYGVIAASLGLNKMTSRESIPALTEVSSYFDSKFGSNNNPINMNTNAN